jgi:hypothetical protein
MRLRQLIEKQMTIETVSGPVTLYHLTNKAKFKLDPNYAPTDNSIAIVDRSGNTGIYLARNVEPWVNGHGYWRPFVAEILADPSALENDTVGRWGGEIFVPASRFDKLKVRRVIPLDAYAREEYGQHGWIENSLGIEFDTGNKITATSYEYPFRGYTYNGDVRMMSPEEVKRLKQHFNAGLKIRLKNR